MSTYDAWVEERLDAARREFAERGRTPPPPAEPDRIVAEREPEAAPQPETDAKAPRINIALVFGAVLLLGFVVLRKK